jgi:biopolymer transport protein ExbB
MKRFFRLQWIVLMVLMSLALSRTGRCEDMRDLQQKAREAREALIQKAADEEAAARREAGLSREKITGDRAALEKAIHGMEARVRGLQKEVRSLGAKDKKLDAREADVSQKLATTDSVMRELVGVIRVNAKDIDALVSGSLHSALSRPDTAVLEAIARDARFPGMEDIRRMTAMLWQQIRGAGEVTLTRGPIVDRSGNSVQADILALGNFTAAYRTKEETGFLSHSDAGRKLFALSRLPDGRMQRQLRRYMEGKSDAVPMDISRGAALTQLTHELSLWGEIPKGGPLVWPILAILVLAIGITVERIIFLLRKRMDTDRLARAIEALAGRRDWPACRKACDSLGGKPVARVLAAGLGCCHMPREAMENALQEAILREVPAMERFLSTLGMLAAIAPLLGLLGTVTGMIDTFHVITLYGTGDPRMMSGGISVALVTTMLGLAVAIPIMLAHTLLSRVADRHIGQMEEKAVALVNIVEKSREAANELASEQLVSAR